MVSTLARLAAVILASFITALLVGCSSTQVLVYHNPLRNVDPHAFLVDTTLLNPNAADHPHMIDMQHWTTVDSIMDSDSLRYLESYPRSEVDTTYMPSEYVSSAHPLYHLSGSRDGKIEKVYISDDSTFVFEPMAYFINGYDIDMMVPFNNENGFKSARIHLSWVDSLSRLHVIDRTPETKTLVRYGLLGGLMMFVVIGSQNGLF
jgi:hypothetical protein